MYVCLTEVRRDEEQQRLDFIAALALQKQLDEEVREEEEGKDREEEEDDDDDDDDNDDDDADDDDYKDNDDDNNDNDDDDINQKVPLDNFLHKQGTQSFNSCVRVRVRVCVL